MSVSCSHYAVFGVKMTYKEYQSLIKDTELDENCDKWDEKTYNSYHDSYYNEDSIGKFRFITDGMSCEYVVFGKILAKGNEEEGIKITECRWNLNDMTDIIRLLDKIVDNSKPNKIIQKNYYVYAFTHYS